MKLKNKIAVLAVLPLFAAVAAIGILVLFQAHRLANLEASVLEDSFLSARRAQLKDYVELALTSIDGLYASGRNDAAAQNEAKAILRSMNYGDDGYFFVYDLSGKNLVHPRQPELEGQNLWELRDASGLPVIQRLIERAREGGGFQRYQWQKPSNKQITQKLSYVVMLDRWGWILGTGVYMDDVEQATHTIRSDITANIRATMWGLALVAMISAIVVFAGGLALNLSEHRLADKKLKELAQGIVTSQEDERARVSRELHDGISQLLVSIKYQFELVEHKLIAGTGEPIRNLKKELAGLAAAIVEVRRISHDLRPSLLDNLGLAAALEQLAKEFSERTGVNAAVHSNVPADVLSEIEAVTLFRIAQEVFTNIERHAHAKTVGIHLDKVGTTVRLSVIDDGRGFDVTGIEHPSKDGIGLRNIRERIEHHGGSLNLASSPGHTELVVTLPIMANA